LPLETPGVGIECAAHLLAVFFYDGDTMRQLALRAGFSLFAVLLWPLPLRVQSQETAPLRGFAPSRTAAQRALEQKALRIPSAEAAERHLRILTAEPHMAGTEGSRRVAEYMRDQLRSFGFEAGLVQYKVWLNQPREVKLELVTPEAKSLATREDPFEWDKDTYNQNVVVGFNGYSPSGEVTAPVVYANYGLHEDYKRLEELGVSVAGKVVLVRYGRSFRGVKTRIAEEKKAAAVLIYSDPADDGYVAGDIYPRGPFRPPSGIQRGSVYYGSHYSGDPLTPGVPALEGARRLSPAESRSLPRTPTMPLNYRDAGEILKHLGGPRVPREWQGGLPFTYHVGPGQASVHLKLEMDYQLRPIYNVIARLRGETDNEWVILGNHHDAWVFGAVDPSSGTASVLEAARALGELVRGGWKPRRTIIVAGWDAEEYGLIGSTEWVEDNLAELQRKAVAYVNMDSAVSGSAFGGSATPSLKELVREVAREVADPKTGRSVYEVWRERAQRGEGRRRAAPGAGHAPPRDADVSLGNLGSGSDFTPFFQHAGIPSLDVGFGGEYGVYHSIYDNFYWMKTFGDPQFLYHAAAARIAALLLLRLSETDTLPFDYEAYAKEIEQYLAELGTVIKQEEGKLDVSDVHAAARAFSASAAAAMKALRALQARMAGDAIHSSAVNRALREVEQAFLSAGLASRPWYRHSVYAPGTYTGYEVVLLPGVREAVDQAHWDAAAKEAAALAAALRRAASKLDEAARLAARPGDIQF
jgi:N-acetylated-alpha-linked acidic dipeptidase